VIRAVRVAATIGIWALAAAGLLGAAVWVLAQFGVVQPLVVVSESMRPALRTGDIVVAVRVPVASLAPGDIVSVARDDTARFITHRLVAAVPASGTDWSLMLKGDANPVADPAAYPVGGEVLKVVWRAPLRLPLGAAAVLGRAEAAWSDVVHAMLELRTPVPGPAPYAITTTAEWNGFAGISTAICPDGAKIEYDWAPTGSWTGVDGGGDSAAIDVAFTWDQHVALHTNARCHLDGRVSDWVPASNNGVTHGIRWPYVSGWSGYTDAPSRRFEAHFECPAGTTGSVVRIGLRRSGSSPTTALWSAPGSHLVVNWSGTMGNGSVAMHVACSGPWGVASTFASHEFGPGCVPTILVAICTDYYLG